MSETESAVKADGADGGGAKWPAGEGKASAPPVTEAALANAAARAAASAAARSARIPAAAAEGEVSVGAKQQGAAMHIGNCKSKAGTSFFGKELL